MTGAAAIPIATPATAPTAAPVPVPWRTVSCAVLPATGTVACGPATPSPGSVQAICSGVTDDATVTVPGATNAQLPKPLAAVHCSGAAQAGSAASTRTSIACVGASVRTRLD